MSKKVELIKLAPAGLTDRVRKFSLQVFGKEVARYELKSVVRSATKVRDEEIDRLLRLIEGFVVSEALGLFDRFQQLYPAILAHMDRGTFGDLVQQAMHRDGLDFRELRGLLVERMVRTMPEMDDLKKAMDDVRKTANRKLAKGWGPVRFASGVKDGRGWDVGDLLLICEHPDGRVWVMAIVESKSISNVGDLAKREAQAVGQHLWDFTRAKASGLLIDGKFYQPNKIEMAPVPVAKQSGPAVVSGKTAKQRIAEMTGYYTQFIGFGPRELTAGEVRNVTAQLVQIEMWQWPFDLKNWEKFQRQLTKELATKVTP